jgi:integrase
MKRRPKGSGTIRITPEGRYRALFAFNTGRREDIDGSPFATHEEAERALDALLVELREAGASRGGITLRRCGQRALDMREKAGYRAIGSERDRWNGYIESHELASSPIRLITRGEIRDLLGSLRNQKTSEPLATQTKKNVLNLLRAVFELAVEDEHIDENPLVGMKVKDMGRTDDTMRPLSFDLASKLLEVATDPVVAIAIGTGMRSGELRALRWEHVDLQDASPHIMVRYGSPPKSPRKNGKVLRVPLFGMALEAFTVLAAATPEEDRTGVVFRSKTGCYRTKGRAVEPKDWKAWLEAAGISRRVRFHDLRHTCATLLLNGDLGRKWTYEEVKELLGHSSVKVTERYAKVLGTLAEKAAAAMRRPKRVKDKSGKGAATSGASQSQAREILERRGSDSNRRMTVLQIGDRVNDLQALERLALLSRSYVEAVAAGDAFAHTKGLDLAAAAWELADAKTAEKSARTG